LIAMLLLVLPMSVLAMDAVTNSELDGVAGQAGVTIAFGGTSTTTIDFSQLGWGDPDGVGTTCASLEGWLIISGVVTISQTIADGQMLTLDVGTTGAGTCVPSGAVNIPANTSFIAVGLPKVTNTITVPSTLYIGLANTSTPIDGTLGILNLRGLSVTMGTPTSLYVWAHP
jgi:hypothetical protein